jgi:transposase InsO family protein
MGMPWSERFAMSLRKEFVLKALASEVPFAELCREFGIARKTGYKWLARFKERGTCGLVDEPRRPSRSPLALSADITLEVVELREAHPRWGPKKIWRLLARTHLAAEVPSISSVARVLKRRGLVRTRRNRARPISAPDRIPVVVVQGPNDLWTADFKGWWRSKNGQRCEPLTVRDAFSRHIMAAKLLKHTRTEEVKSEFESLFSRYGLPKAIQTDNGPPFASVIALGGLTKLSVWWVSLGIKLIRGRPGCPQDNGAHERMHADMRIEIQADAAPTLGAQQAICDEWVHEFNHVRPHEALGLRTPAEVYRPSDRKFGHIVLEGRPADCDLRPVFSGGWIKYRAQRVYVTDALRGFRVALREVGEEVHVHFFDLLLGRFRPGVDRSVHPFGPARSNELSPDEAGQAGAEKDPRQTRGLRPPEPSRAPGRRGLSRRRSRPPTAAAGASASTPAKARERDTRPDAEADSEAR